MAIWRSSSGIVEAVRERLEIAVSSSSRLETPPVESRLVKSHRLVVKLHGAPGYLELQIQLPQSEIRLGDIGHERNKDASLGLFRREKYCARGFRVRAGFCRRHRAPTPGRILRASFGNDGWHRMTPAGRWLARPVARCRLRVEIELRKQERSDYADLRPRLLHPGGGNAQVIVIL